MLKRVKFHKLLFWVPILAAGGPYWVLISKKVGSLLGPYLKAWWSLLVLETVCLTRVNWWTASGKILLPKQHRWEVFKSSLLVEKIPWNKCLNIPGQWHDLSKTRSCLRHCTSCKYVLFWIKCKISSSTSTFICTVTDLGKDLPRACCRRTVDIFLNPNSCPVGTCATDTGIQ